MSDRLLNLEDTVLQSLIIHPEWTVETHLCYIQSECFHLDATEQEVRNALHRARARQAAFRG